MGYAETQDEIIRAHLRDRSPAHPRLATVQAPPSVRATPSALPAPRPVTGPGVAVAARPARPIPPSDDTEAELTAAVAAARRLRYTAEVEQIVGAAGVTVDQMRGRRKGRELVEVRRIVAAYLRRRGCSLPEIGRVLNRDHTSVLNLLRASARRTGPYEEQAS